MPGPIAAGPGIGANAPKNKLAGIGMTAFAAFGGILFGYDTGTISGIIAMPDWLKLFGRPCPADIINTTDCTQGFYIPSSRQSLVVSILSAGTFFGESPNIPAEPVLMLPLR